MAVLAWRLRPVRLTVDDQGLRLTSELGRSTEIPWSAVTGLELESNWRTLRITAAGGIRRDGRLVDAGTHRFRGFGNLASSTSRTLTYLQHRHARAIGRPDRQPTDP
ncbi:hypothetical protein DT076_09140 [Desertihabitans brevis]|uniref:Low molecular weight protein antigen 6 PH domain-containing protein n=1 Tax=Desertihabitans brevis TaxID=2268447 RepID=A0A367YUQ3_9ACTN|nr:PH domain-containing protein [Desertihabitans brevis]RCK69616.1 hypothetical protein DT076_09140 [Desertihabitans brevis]